MKEMKKDEFVESAAEATHWLETHWRTAVRWVRTLPWRGYAEKHGVV